MMVWDAVIVGAGGAGLSAAISISEWTENFIIITCSRIGDSNTARAHGGIQFPVLPVDSPEIHFDDTYRGGNYKGNKDLIRILTGRSLETLHWLRSIGMDFDKKDKGYVVKRCRGISVPRILTRGTRIGSAIQGVLLREIRKRKVRVLTGTVLTRIYKEKGYFTLSVHSKEGHSILKTMGLILCTGGRGVELARRAGYGTTNQSYTDFKFYDSLKKLGVRMIQEDSFQFHPFCISKRGRLYGIPVLETLWSLGGRLYDNNNVEIPMGDGKRDELTNYLFSVFKKSKGIKAPDLAHDSLFLDIRDVLKLPDLVDEFGPYLKRLKAGGIDPFNERIPVAPMVHYQNGGIEIDENCRTNIDGLYAAGEVTGGIHGTNRLMGNSLLDILVFGRIAGESCGRNLKEGG